jgi:D-glycero-alpha-D-manno-heptose 1-phosphate guanylyltransferase
MHALILAGGFGTRLQSSIGTDIPKPMAPINGEPFLALYIRKLASVGITEVTLSLFHLHEVIREHFGVNYQGIPIHYAVEPAPLGTGGAIAYALAQHVYTQPIYVTNGDSFSDVNVRDMLHFHQQQHAALTMALRKVDNCARYGQVSLNAQNYVAEFNYPGAPESGLISTGGYIATPDLFANITLPEQFSFEHDFIKPQCSRMPIAGYVTDSYFIDIGIAEDFERAQAELPPRVPQSL